MAKTKSQPGVELVNIPDARGYQYALTDIDNLTPDPENPRIPVQGSSLETVLALVADDRAGLYNLAKDIVEKGMNPAELFSVSPLGGGQFVVREGNRRIAARRLLRNPEQLSSHIPSGELAKWRTLAGTDGAKALPKKALVVIGEDHSAWVDRRHLGPQAGAGLVPWDTQMKTRRDATRHGAVDRAAALLEGLTAVDPGTFAGLAPPKRTYTTFQRLLDSEPARERIGIGINEKRQLVLTKGKRSAKLIEQALRDLRATGKEKLTSRVIHDSNDIAKYLDRLEARIGAVESEGAIVLREGVTAAKSKKKQPARGGGAGDILKAFTRPKAATRLGKLYDELAKSRKHEMPNAGVVLIRILLELAIDHYAAAKSLSIGSDLDADVQAEIAAFRAEVGQKGITIPKGISQGLKAMATRAPNLDKKLEIVIDSLVKDKTLNQKEGAAKKRELREKETVALLHDAVHRLETVPSPARVTHILEVIAPIFNGMEPDRP